MRKGNKDTHAGRVKERTGKGGMRESGGSTFKKQAGRKSLTHIDSVVKATRDGGGGGGSDGEEPKNRRVHVMDRSEKEGYSCR